MQLQRHELADFRSEFNIPLTTHEPTNISIVCVHVGFNNA